MDGAPTGDDAYDIFGANLTKHKGDKFVSVSSIVINDCTCNIYTHAQ